MAEESDEVRTAINMVLTAAADKGHTLTCITEALEYHLEYARRAQEIMDLIDNLPQPEHHFEHARRSQAIRDLIDRLPSATTTHDPYTVTTYDSYTKRGNPGAL